MAIEQMREGRPGSEQRMGVDVGAQAGTGTLGQSETQTALSEMADQLASYPKPLKPLPHAVIDYAMAGTLMAAPWLFGFSRNKMATTNAVASGVAVLGLSLMTRYPLGVVKAIPFPVHGIIETAAALMNTAAPWLMGFSHHRSAKWTHVMSGLGTLAVVALTDYRAAEQTETDGTSGNGTR